MLDLLSTIRRGIAARAVSCKPATAERGVTALEYAFIAGLISIAAVGVLYLIGTDLGAYFTRFAQALSP
ncbi:Flp family type IVb pilin [Zavarzinia compransoris]|uniref:Flp family type IVb pilin n=1 Tax=Zavarzinia compransoris TaxID=1264899 RepID=A0A317EAK0_9PROT|nr:Flp family type IVb pilin [Zavarzinia compransoris]PWR23256.1 Flp family type IVb pilin [Zavarzinia compransoris]TDP46180.1 Flp pilus assembly pilin Flp [Zavarzinia compransoris]